MEPREPVSLLHFNGPVTHGKIEHITEVLMHGMEVAPMKASVIMDIFSVYIEMIQNVAHYAASHDYCEQDAFVTVDVECVEGRYVVATRNLVEMEDGRRLVGTVQSLARLDKQQLKAAYKERLRQPRDPRTGHAGLGLFSIARTSNLPLQASLTERPEGRAVFTLQAAI
jgi:hypothetical protein